MLDNRNSKINKNIKYICKKSIYNFVKGNYYDVNELFSYMIEIIIIVNNQRNYYCFSLEKEYDESFPNFIRHFYTENEERVLKLDKLNTIEY